jgi:hypothetical protein
VRRRWYDQRGLSGGLRATGLVATTSARKGLCAGHDERDDDSPYEASDVRQKSSGGRGCSSGGPALGEGEWGDEVHVESVLWIVGRKFTEEG